MTIQEALQQINAVADDGTPSLPYVSYVARLTQHHTGELKITHQFYMGGGKSNGWCDETSTLEEALNSALEKAQEIVSEYEVVTRKVPEEFEELIANLTSDVRKNEDA